MSANVTTFRKCNPLYGYRWLADGLRLFLGQAWAWLALVGITLVGILFLSILPLLGVAAIFVLFPCVSAGFLIAARAANAGEVLRFTHLGAGCKTQPKTLLATGALAFGLFFLVLILLTVGWREQFIVLIKLTQGPAADQAAFLSAANALTTPTLIAMGTLLFIAIATWFAPGLIIFQRHSARAAIAMSLRACLGNVAPFIVFAVLVFISNLALSFLLRLLLAAAHGIGGAQAANILGMFLSFPLVCGFTAVLFAAAYLSYTDVFEARPAKADGAAIEADVKPD